LSSTISAPSSTLRPSSLTSRRLSAALPTRRTRASRVLRRRPASGALRCGHGRLLRVEPAGVLGERRLRERIDADDLAAEQHRVEVRLQDLALLPAPVQLGCRKRLADLLHHAAPAGRAKPSSSRPASCIVSVEAPRAFRFQTLPHALCATALQSTPLCA